MQVDLNGTVFLAITPTEKSLVPALDREALCVAF